MAESLWENTDDLEASLSEEAVYLQSIGNIYHICPTQKVSITLLSFWIGHRGVSYLPTAGIFVEFI